MSREFVYWPSERTKVHLNIALGLLIFALIKLKNSNKTENSYLLRFLWMVTNIYIYRLQHWGPKIWEHFLGVKPETEKKVSDFETIQTKESSGVKRISHIVILIMCPIYTLQNIMVSYFTTFVGNICTFHDQNWQRRIWRGS